MPTPKSQVSDDGFAPSVSQSFGANPHVEPSELTSLREAEKMLIEKESRIDAMCPIQSANEGRDIGSVKAKWQVQLAIVRKEIARVTAAANK